MRRVLCLLFIMTTAVVGSWVTDAGLTPAVAQEATPAGISPAALGYPELRVRLSDEKVEAPAETPAGLTVLTLENATTETQEGVFLMTPKVGASVAEVQSWLGTLTLPLEEVPDGAIFGGGPFALPGHQGQVIVRLEPGAWLLVAEQGAAPALLNVTATSDAAAVQDPEADLAVTLDEFAFGFPGTVAPGPRLWKVTNVGDQPHVLALNTAPDGVTTAQMMALIQSFATGTPVPELTISLEDVVDVGGLAVLSPGRTVWLLVDLAPGTYVAVCFIPDSATGMPHAMLGMVGIFTVGDAAAT